MLTDRLIDAMGLLKLQAKGNTQPKSDRQATVIADKSTAIPAQIKKAKPHSMDVVKLDKSEFRLLVKMLHAIDHECTYDHISFDGHTVTYQHPKKTLVFNDITLPDTQQLLNLSSLSDLLSDPALKRPVWEKLKSLK